MLPLITEVHRSTKWLWKKPSSVLQDIPLRGNDSLPELRFGKKCSEKFSCCYILYFSSGSHPLMSYIFWVVKEPLDVELHFREREGIGMMGTRGQVWMYSDYWGIVQRRDTLKGQCQEHSMLMIRTTLSIVRSWFGLALRYISYLKHLSSCIHFSQVTWTPRGRLVCHQTAAPSIAEWQNWFSFAPIHIL